MASVGCAHGTDTNKQVADAAVQTRIEEVERTNGRLSVRIEELERQLLLVQDRIEASRIAMQRGGQLREERPVVENNARRPQPAPESYYGHSDAYSADPSLDQRIARRPVSRIALSADQSGAMEATAQPKEAEITLHVEDELEDDGEVLVITDADFRAFAGPDFTSAPSQSPSSVTGAGRNAQPPVTSERLATSGELNRRSGSEAQPVKPSAGGDLLSVYQDALAEYRAGNYGQALEGFQSFLDAGPRADYLDNALYWIGECHYGLGDYTRSVQYFQRIIEEIPNGSKAADAMLKMSLAYDRMGQGGEAVSLLETLTKQHPTTNSGKLAAKRLLEHPQRQ
ncbi:MAG: tol-pal system protein YbgF [Bradymonadaceae bacterium]|nr:tol-pal system protein YbgF [Lujinxingiaceae bacterium]